MAKYIVSQHFKHPKLGEISIIVKSSSRNMSARWSNGLLKITIPERITVEEFDKVLNQMAPRLLAKRPAVRHYAVGWTYKSPNMTFVVVRGKSPDVLRVIPDHEAKITAFHMPLCYPDEGHDYFDRFVTDTLKRYANVFGQNLVLYARVLAGKLGVNPRSISMSYGLRTLGRCNSKGDVLLSKNLIFYPRESWLYVVAHEFAHLTHLNHGPGFHALLNRYLEGREAELKSLTDHHKSPFL